MKYRITIEAQVLWETDVEADSSDAAVDEAKENFESSQWTNSTKVELINSITVEAAADRADASSRK